MECRTKENMGEFFFSVAKKLLSDQQLCVNVFEGAGETDTVHKSEGQTQVTLQPTTTAHVLIWHVGSDDNCYVTAYNS